MDAKLAVELSRQWRNGAPASTLKAAGVLLHVIDGGMGGIFHNDAAACVKFGSHANVTAGSERQPRKPVAAIEPSAPR